MTWLISCCLQARRTAPAEDEGGASAGSLQFGESAGSSSDGLLPSPISEASGLGQWYDNKLYVVAAPWSKIVTCMQRRTSQSLWLEPQRRMTGTIHISQRPRCLDSEWISLTSPHHLSTCRLAQPAPAILRRHPGFSPLLHPRVPSTTKAAPAILLTSISPLQAVAGFLRPSLRTSNGT